MTKVTIGADGGHSKRHIVQIQTMGLRVFSVQIVNIQQLLEDDWRVIIEEKGVHKQHLDQIHTACFVGIEDATLHVEGTDPNTGVPLGSNSKYIVELDVNMVGN